MLMTILYFKNIVEIVHRKAYD